jgi:hypothetical protein
MCGTSGRIRCLCAGPFTLIGRKELTMSRLSALAVILCLTTALTFAATPVTVPFSDNFDSYASQASFENVWDSASNGANRMILTSAQDHTTGSGQSVLKPGDTLSYRSGIDLASPEAPTNASPLVLECWLYDDFDGNATDGNDHARCGIAVYSYTGGWTVGLQDYCYLGTYGSTTLANYVRQVRFGTNYTDTSIARTAGWHHLVIRVLSASADFWIDGASAGADTSAAFPLTNAQFVTLAQNVSSLNDDNYIDDVVISRNGDVPVELSTFSTD